MKQWEYDVAIIGLGPAGATLARLLDSGLRVIAIDKKDPLEDGGFRKPCGGLLAPDAQKALSRFDLSLPKDVLVSPQIFNVRTIDLPTGLTRHYQRSYINLDRHKFDVWLGSLIPGRVTVRYGARCTEIRPVPPGYQVSFRAGTSTETVTARYVVGADGANSRVRRLAAPGASIRTYLSIQQWFADEHANPFYSCVFDPDSTDCYAWGLTKDRHFLFGGAFAVEDGRERFEALKAKLVPYGFYLDRPLKTEACLVLRPSGAGDWFPGRDGLFLAGEAAGLISPSSLEGISYAIESAYRLSRVLNSRAEHPNARYRSAIRPIKAKLVGKHLKSPFMYRPLLRRMVMASGLSSISMIPSDPQRRMP